MRRGASTSISFVVEAVEILDFPVSLVEMEVKIATAIGTDQKARKHITLSIVGTVFSHFTAFFLNLLADDTLNDRLMHILKATPQNS